MFDDLIIKKIEPLVGPEELEAEQQPDLIPDTPESADGIGAPDEEEEEEEDCANCPST